jgi:anti-anti-sigma regulatory factor
MGLKAAMSSAHVVLTNDLDLDARKAFIAATCVSIQSESHGGSPVEVDCVAVESFGPVDEAVIGMLVTLARASQRNGARVALVRAAQPMRAQLEIAGVAHFFDWAG